MKNITSKMMKPTSMWSNPLFIIVMLLLGLIIVLAIFRSASPFLNLGFGVNAHIGELRGSFELEAFDNSNEQPTFVMYYAEWCGHCKTTLPEFNKLKNNYNGNIKIIAIDSEAAENIDLVKSQKIAGFPTIRYYANGISEDFQDYTGGRTYTDFVQYLGSISGMPDIMPDNAAPV